MIVYGITIRKQSISLEIKGKPYCLIDTPVIDIGDVTMTTRQYFYEGIHYWMIHKTKRNHSLWKTLLLKSKYNIID